MDDEILSIVIDIGTSTSQMIISKLRIKNEKSSFSIPQIVITGREVIYRSPIIFTPHSKDNLLDIIMLQKFIDNNLKTAHVNKSNITSGAAIITGESARKENAEMVAKLIAASSGEFVVSTAGPDLESIVAGRGSGAEKFSKLTHQNIINFDIGGGTTNLACFLDGLVTDTACFDIGGRHLKFDSQQIINYISPKALKIIQKEKLNLSLNRKLDSNSLHQLAKIFVQVLENAANLGTPSPYFDFLITNKSLKNPQPEAISFSGGIAKILKEPQENPYLYGDMGIILAEEISKSKLMTLKQFSAKEDIRATVIGAGTSIMQLSGSTISYNSSTLPVRNIPVLYTSPKTISKDLSEKLPWFDLNEFDTIAISMSGIKNPTFKELIQLKNDLLNNLTELIKKKRKLIILTKEDNAKALGQLLQNALARGYPYICLDEISAKDGDYLDIAKPIVNGSVLPVSIKTLIFE